MSPPYEVVVVQGDGVPYPVLETPDLTVALVERDSRLDQHGRKGHHYFCGVTDLDDPERGWLEWPEDE